MRMADSRPKTLCEYDYMMSGLDGLAQPLLTDLYQITMAYAYWCAGKHKTRAAFDLFFRTNPFQGEFTVFAGLGDCVEFLRKFRYSASDLDYLRTQLPTVKPEFFVYLGELTAKDVTLYAVAEGTVVFPRVPLLRVEGPLALVQLMETTFLNLINFASLVATNAARFRLAAGPEARLLEFGLRRAQGPNGGLSASKYAYIGGFDGTSNVMAGKLFKIPVAGTHAHAFVMSFSASDVIEDATLVDRAAGERLAADASVVNREAENPARRDLYQLSVEWRRRLMEFSAATNHVWSDPGKLRADTSQTGVGRGPQSKEPHVPGGGCSALFETSQANDGELRAFVSYALAFPDRLLALVDTYDVLRSGLVNFCAVALALDELGYRPVGIRIDSGDLAYLSRRARHVFDVIGLEFQKPFFADLIIVASNDINEETIISLNEQGHRINCFGIGTHLVTCQKQPALGCVFKLVEIDGQPCIKLSNDLLKVTIPGRKNAFRLYGHDDGLILDLLQLSDEEPPQPGRKVLCRHPFITTKRALVCPQRVEPMYEVYWADGELKRPPPEFSAIRDRVIKQMQALRPDMKRVLNPTPYKVSVSEKLYAFMHDLWLQNAPIGELS